mgnify:FL=1
MKERAWLKTAKVEIEKKEKLLLRKEIDVNELQLERSTAIENLKKREMSLKKKEEDFITKSKE